MSPSRRRAALPAVAHRRGARLGIPHTLRVLHATACQRGLPVRGTVRGRIAHPARCHNRAAITHAIFARGLRTTTWHAHYPGGAMLARRGSRLAPYRPYTRVGGRRHYPCALRRPCPVVRSRCVRTSRGRPRHRRSSLPARHRRSGSPPGRR